MTMMVIATKMTMAINNNPTNQGTHFPLLFSDVEEEDTADENPKNTEDKKWATR